MKEQLRTNEIIEDIMFNVWEEHFDDIPRKNLVLIKFGKFSARRLGSIRWVTNHTRVKTLLKKYEKELEYQDDRRVSLITLTKYYEYTAIPDTVVKMTIAHELVHYAHGFHSPLPKLYAHPHRGNIVNKELVVRGMKSELEESEVWIKNNWVNYIRMITKMNK